MVPSKEVNGLEKRAPGDSAPSRKGVGENKQIREDDNAAVNTKKNKSDHRL